MFTDILNCLNLQKVAKILAVGLKKRTNMFSVLLWDLFNFFL